MGIPPTASRESRGRECGGDARRRTPAHAAPVARRTPRPVAACGHSAVGCGVRRGSDRSRHLRLCASEPTRGAAEPVGRHGGQRNHPEPGRPIARQPRRAEHDPPPPSYHAAVHGGRRAQRQTTGQVDHRRARRGIPALGCARRPVQERHGPPQIRQHGRRQRARPAQRDVRNRACDPATLWRHGRPLADG